MLLQIRWDGAGWPAYTRGKPYHAQGWNIAKFTNNRFNPRPGELAEVVTGLESEEPEGLPSVMPIRELQVIQTVRRSFS